ncbi:hypothetical protein [Hydrogenimonas cancrithermarum]|uniref:Uncharacterized protein n=1 Tax=Hydrogenimonas cancrithermarum TaxID=2993563 RepID=A0ABM8FIG1_9BACT|nr:hypothetical protein [Hydrogenimonas cancrithermarum]BDY12073.1 hypothetical protein HCR_03850 [Hydrogenimonas cancrithermarum]
MDKPTLEELETMIEKLKVKYRKKKEELEWCDNDYDAGFVQEEMEKIKLKIKTCRAEIDAMEAENKSS